MFILCYGYLEEGLGFVGPFTKEGEAETFALQHKLAKHEVIEIMSQGQAVRLWESCKIEKDFQEGGSNSPDFS